MARSRSEVVRSAYRFGLTEADVDRIAAERGLPFRHHETSFKLRMGATPGKTEWPLPLIPSGLSASIEAELRAKGRSEVLAELRGVHELEVWL